MFISLNWGNGGRSFASPRGRRPNCQPSWPAGQGGPALWQAAAPPTHTCTHARTPMSPNSPHTHGQPPPHSGSLAGRSPALLAGPHHRTPPVLPDGVRVPVALPHWKACLASASQALRPGAAAAAGQSRAAATTAATRTMQVPHQQWVLLHRSGRSCSLSRSLSLTLPWRHGRTHGSRHRPPR